MAKVIIFGTGQIAEIAHFYIENDSEHEIVAFTLDSDYIENDNFKGLPVIPFESIEEAYPPSDYKMFIPISYKNVNKVRREKYFTAKEKGYSFISYISSKARYYNTEIGENCFIFEDNVIQPYTKIGNNCILWSGNHIGHHTTIKDHCFLASHVVISGSVVVDELTFIGVNATIRDNITIGKENVIGAAAIILKSTEDYEVYAARRTEKHKLLSHELKGI